MLLESDADEIILSIRQHHDPLWIGAPGQRLAVSGIMTDSTATPLRSPSAEPVAMRALAGTPFCTIAFAEILFNDVPFKDVPFVAILAPAGITQASSAARINGVP